MSSDFNWKKTVEDINPAIRHLIADLTRGVQIARFMSSAFERRFSRQGCCLGCEKEEVSDLTCFYPLLVEDKDGQRFFGSLPFFYTVFSSGSKTFSYLEVLEVPFIDPCLFFQSSQRYLIEQSLPPSSQTFVACLEKKALNDLGALFASARESAVRHLFSLFPRAEYIQFSAFSVSQEVLVKKMISGYLLFAEEVEKQVYWENYSKRVMPLIWNCKLFPISLTCWSVTRAGFV